MQIEDVPPELSDLNPLEVRLTVELNNCTIKKQFYGDEIEVVIGGSSDITTSPCEYDKLVSTEVNLIIAVTVYVVFMSSIMQ